MSRRIAIESLAMDLKRVSLGKHRGSSAMAERFKIEAIKRETELTKESHDPYLKSLLERSHQALESDDSAEDLLMYSTLLQNLALVRYTD